MQRLVVLLVLLSSFILQPSSFSQGPLTPPPGPPGPTMKTLDQVQPRIPISSFPFNINSGGSYYLTANLIAGVGNNGITVNAHGVTIDLNGFALASFSGNTAITVAGAFRNLCVRNGTISGWSGNGIDAGAATNNVFEDLRFSDVTGTALKAGDNSVVTRCVFTSATAGGLVAGNGCVISHCAAAANGGVGIKTGESATVTACSSNNTSAGGHGFDLGTGSVISNCSAEKNTGKGVVVASNSAVTACAVFINHGIGIDAGTRSMVSHCTVEFGDDDGIRVANLSRVLENHCSGNGTGGTTNAGIHVTASQNRIEANELSGNFTRGIKVDFSGNLIIRNSASGNVSVNYEIAANNVFGAIVDRTAPASGIVTGSSAASSAATTDPWANISY